MNGTPSDDRLSAWLDDELSLAERAEIEQQLAESPDMRQEADELRQVSELVRGLPVEKAPEELQPAVMRSIERDTLLAGESQTVGSGGRRPSRRQDPKVLLGAIAALALAAVIMLMNGEEGPDPNAVDQPREFVETSVPPVEAPANHPEQDDEQPPNDEPENPASDEQPSDEKSSEENPSGADAQRS